MKFASKKSILLWTLVIVFWISNLAYRPFVWTVIGAIGVIVCAFGILLLLTGKWRTSILWVTLIGVALWLLNLGKRVFWKDRLKFEDFTIFTDFSNFETLLHYPLETALFVVFSASLIALAVKAFVSDSEKIQHRFKISVLAIILGSSSATLSWQQGHQQWLASPTKGSNVIANLLMSSSMQYVSPAAQFSNTYIFPSERPSQMQNKPLSDVILILQESTFDPRRLKGVDIASVPPLSMFDSPWATQQGALRVHTYGGGTWRSEFSALTGLSSADFGILANSVFYSAVFHVQDSLWKRLKAAGYKIIIVTPFAEGSYNSGKAYRQLGVDEIIHVTELGWEGNKRKNVWNIPTANILSMIRGVMEKELDRPIAVYALTMNEHGPYEAKNTHTLKPEGQINPKDLARLADYVDRLIAANDAVVAFDEWVAKRARPTVMIRFGDHQPGLSWRAGYRTALATPEKIADFALIDNQTQGREPTPEITDIIFLASIILERIGVEEGPFYSTASTMRSLCQNRYEDCEDKTLLKAYRQEIYVNQKIAE